MKSLYLFCLSIFISFVSFSQNVITAEENIEHPNNYRQEWQQRHRQQASQGINNKSGVCDTDTLMYSQYKSTSTRYINMNTSNSAHGYGQYFRVKDTVLIYGFSFYCYSTDFFGGPEPATANFYFATVNGVPAGAPIISIPVNIPYASPFPLNNIKHTVMFPTPYKAFFNFIVSIESPTIKGIAVATNNWDLGDGDMKGFSCAKFATGWAKGTNVTVGATTPPTVFDADIFIEPIVSYKIKSNFKADKVSCLGNGEIFKFENTSTPLLFDEFNPLAADSINDDSFEWDYGDGSPLDSVVHGANNYVSTSITSYNVTLKSGFTGWTTPNGCSDTYTGLIKKPNLDAKFTNSVNLGVVTFTDQSVDAEDWDWDFGDGATDTVQSPVHTYGAAGIYKVTQYVYNGGCIDSAVSTIQVENTGVNELSDLGIKVYPNPVKNELTIHFGDNSTYRSLHLVADVYSLTGSRVVSVPLKNGDSFVSLDMSGLKPGSYLLKLADDRGNLLGRSMLVKE